MLVAQRVYGITFPDKKQLAEHLERLAEAKKRDHRNVGTQMELFMFDKLSPGSCFFMPNGTCVYNALVEVWQRFRRSLRFAAQQGASQLTQGNTILSPHRSFACEPLCVAALITMCIQHKIQKPMNLVSERVQCLLRSSSARNTGSMSTTRW